LYRDKTGTYQRLAQWQVTIKFGGMSNQGGKVTPKLKGFAAPGGALAKPNQQKREFMVWINGIVHFPL